MAKLTIMEKKKTKPMVWYVTKNGINLYEVFRAGVIFGGVHSDTGWKEDEWLAALEASLPEGWDK
ncbi:MAG: hypothetical protein ABSC07_19315 [Terriglobales bacterium]|jgi:hypothetical protein